MPGELVRKSGEKIVISLDNHELNPNDPLESI